MATEKVGVYRKWHGLVPIDKTGTPLPKKEWPRTRPFSWAVRWFGVDGKRFSKSFGSRREAERYAETKQAEVRMGKGDQPRAVTLAEFARMYLDLRGDLASMTKVEHARTLRFLNEFLGKQMTVSKITSLDARRFLAWYREREYRGRTPAPAKVNKVLRECKRIFREAVACSLTRENPFHEMRQEKVGQRPWQFLSPTEFRKLIEASPSLRWQGMITLGYGCGLRLGEVLNLTWSDVDFERSQVRIVRKDASEHRAAWPPILTQPTTSKLRPPLYWRCSTARAGASMTVAEPFVGTVRTATKPIVSDPSREFGTRPGISTYAVDPGGVFVPEKDADAAAEATNDQGFGTAGRLGHRGTKEL